MNCFALLSLLTQLSLPFESCLEDAGVRALLRQVETAAEILVVETVSFRAEEKEEASYHLVGAPRVVVSPGGQNPYQSLPISRADKQNINDLLTTMAENNVFQLLFQKSRLERLGQEIDHVHPICFIGTVFSNPHLTSCMYEIRKSSFKWTNFVDGFGKRLKQELNRNNVAPYVSGFAEHLNLPRNEVERFLQRGDFEGLVLYIMNSRR